MSFLIVMLIYLLHMGTYTKTKHISVIQSMFRNVNLLAKVNIFSNWLGTAFIFKATIVACCPETVKQYSFYKASHQSSKSESWGLGKSVCPRFQVGPIQKVTLAPETGWVPQNYFSKKPKVKHQLMGYASTFAQS